MEPNELTNPPKDANPYAAPIARIEETVVEEGQVKADRVARLLAVLIDSGVVVIPVLLAIAVPAYQSYVRRASGQAVTDPDAIMIGVMVALGLLVLAYAIYQLYLLWKNGQTIGKKVMKIKIVRKDGSRAGLRRIFFLRMLVPGLAGNIPLLGILFALADPLFIFGNDQRCLHDLIADTIVINA